MPQNHLVRSPRTVAPGQEKYVTLTQDWIQNGTRYPKCPGDFIKDNVDNRLGIGNDDTIVGTAALQSGEKKVVR
jgi:hypothetical protein